MEQKVTKRYPKNGHFWALFGPQYDDFHSKLQKWVEKGVIFGYLLVTKCSKNVDFAISKATPSLPLKLPNGSIR